MTRRIRVALALMVSGAAFVSGTALAAPPRKAVITRAADVPRFNYPMRGKVEDVIMTAPGFRPFAVQVRKDVESVLADYEIADAATRRELLGVLVALDLLEGHDADARRRLDTIRALEDKPAQKLMSGLVARAILQARQRARDSRAPAFRQALAQAMRQALEALPYDVVQNDARSMKARYELLSESLIIGQIRGVMDPVVARTGALSSELAHALPNARFVIVELLPVRQVLTDAVTAYLAAHTQAKPDIWAARDVVLEAGRRLTLVPVAVWDTGVDLAIFKDRIARDRRGAPLVLAYDLQMRRTTGELTPLPTEVAPRRPQMQQLAKGFSDLQANLDTPEASQLKKLMAALTPEQVRPFIESLVMYGIHAHGTHVAGIVMAGNPFARLVTGRITFDHKLIPDPCPSRELSGRMAAAYQDYVAFFKRSGVRVVNMSWGGSVNDFEQQLERCGRGTTPAERKQTARELFTVVRDALERALASAPEILFVAAAGNSNDDSTFQESIPSCLRLPNLLTVGAVDRAGDEVSFTSYGPTVVVHANGYEVDSAVPGGDRLRFSGTSMAAPSTANLAAKILAVSPKLTPAKVIEIIRATAEKTADGRRTLIHPKRALEALRPQRR